MGLLDGSRSVNSVENSQFWSECLRTIYLIDGTPTQQGPEWVCLMVLSTQLEYSQLLVSMFQNRFSTGATRPCMNGSA